MTNTLRLVLAQVNPTVGDLQSNLKLHLKAAESALLDHQADLIIFPELSLTGYPPEDLLFRQAFLEETKAALETFAEKAPALYCLVGHPHFEDGKLYNACSLFFKGTLIARYYKQHLPNYGVFDERRYFTAGDAPCVINIKGVALGLIICEDIWVEGPVKQAVDHGARLILVSNASPYETDKYQNRLHALYSHATTHHVTMVYANLVGGQDELIFDGSSMVVNPAGELTHFAGRCNEMLLSVDIDANANPIKPDTKPVVADGIETLYQALVLSLRDYVNKNRFSSVILGLSGGIDSALTLAIAVDALGAERVHAVLMPSRFTEKISVEDATRIAANFNVALTTLSIEPTYTAFLASLESSFVDRKLDVTEENIQARCRAVLLMALSNKFGHLVLTTGNRSEIAVGYCTLYGDMAGGFAILKDVPKTLVYALSHYRNTISTMIPSRIIERPPTAELAANQKDEDSLPPYPVLDAILFGYLNQNKSIAELVAAGFEEAIVTKVVNLIYKSEYKRHQSAPGPHINHKSFTKDWRYPITDRFKG